MARATPARRHAAVTIHAKESAINHPAVSSPLASPQTPPGTPSCADQAIRAALQLVVTSRQFGKAHRCVALLTYLIERTLTGNAAAPPQELEIGIAVFGRDPRSYFPGDDPIVRVQAGRLRLRLAAYYADEGAGAPLRIAIPLGSYQARVALAGDAPDVPASELVPVLMFRPITCLSSAAPAGCLASGLSDELAFRLFRDLPAFRLMGPDIVAAGASRQGAVHVLEGTLRQDAARLRVSLYLRHGSEGTVLWYQQFDSAGAASIADQEQLAERCVQALRRHMLADGRAPMAARV